MLQTYCTLSLLVWNGAWIWQSVHFGHSEISDPDQVYFHSLLEVSATNISIKDNVTIAIGIGFHSIGICHVFVSVHQHVRMRVAPNEWSILLKEESKREDV